VTFFEVFELFYFFFLFFFLFVVFCFYYDERGNDRKSVEPFLGGRSRVSEVLSRKRNLSMNQIRKLHSGLHIPLENLIGAN